MKKFFVQFCENKMVEISADSVQDAIAGVVNGNGSVTKSSNCVTSTVCGSSKPKNRSGDAFMDFDVGGISWNEAPDGALSVVLADVKRKLVSFGK